MRFWGDAIIPPPHVPYPKSSEIERHCPLIPLASSPNRMKYKINTLILYSDEMSRFQLFVNFQYMLFIQLRKPFLL